MIIVNKFGGGIVNGASSIKHLLEIFKNFPPQDCSVNVFSAFDKTTNELEKIAKSCLKKEKKESEELLDKLKVFHLEIASELFPKEHVVFDVLENEFKKISDKLSFAEQMEDLQFIDQILPHGEILTTLIVSNYFAHIGIPNKLIYATDFLQTDSNFSSANVDKEATALNLNLEINGDILKLHKHIITQGFIGFSKNETKSKTKNNAESNTKIMTTLGREGSDYTAGILSDLFCANKIILWKDVPGVMDKNPKLSGNENAKKIDLLTYDNLENLLQNAALGLVHPKTLNEVRKKKIPLQIRPFWDLDSAGTLIS